MKNREVTTTEGEKVWIHRSTATCTLIFAGDGINEDALYVLLVKRGSRCPDYVGYWCLPCGYVDYDETLREAAVREVYEETGLSLDPDDLLPCGADDDPKSDPKQNITMRYAYLCADDVDELSSRFSLDNCEPNEIDAIEFVDIRDLGYISIAFNHKELIEKMAKRLLNQ